MSIRIYRFINNNIANYLRAAEISVINTHSSPHTSDIYIYLKHTYIGIIHKHELPHRGRKLLTPSRPHSASFLNIISRFCRTNRTALCAACAHLTPRLAASVARRGNSKKDQRIRATGAQRFYV